MFLDDNFREMFKIYCRTFSSILTIMNNEVNNHKMVMFDNDWWDGNTAPQIGSARKEAEENEDLLL